MLLALTSPPGDATQIRLKRVHIFSCGRRVSVEILYHLASYAVDLLESKMFFYIEMVKILKYNLPKDLEIFLLGLNVERVRSEDQVLIWYMILAA